MGWTPPDAHESPHFVSDSILPRRLAKWFVNESILQMAGQCGRTAQRLEFIENHLNSLFGSDLHAKRVSSLSYGVLGVMTSASLAVSVIGQALAQARGKSAKQADDKTSDLKNTAGGRKLGRTGASIWRMSVQCTLFCQSFKLGGSLKGNPWPRGGMNKISPPVFRCQRRRDFAAAGRSKSAAQRQARRPPISGAFLLVSVSLVAFHS
jgi:hypothetical protein